ncbi:hypothetical protein F5Y18DRAFT_141145 [Xylariaceae sp. FL1019]|nr:hypothetical protein F5Y18DRAFT_141145 [Xylariaceae sp. FL1019]
MASRKVSVLKFVGTTSLGLLTGASYTLSAYTIPALLEHDSASNAANALRSLKSIVARHLTALAGLSGSAFLLAFSFSPRGYRHPYLLYTSLFCFGFGSPLADYVTPALFGTPSASSPSIAERRAALAQARLEKAASKRMEQSYEMLSDEEHSEEGTASASGEELEEDINGEEVRNEVAFFIKNQIVRTTIAAVGFAMATVGIWGDGSHRAADTLVVEVY